jgi:TOTE conflict system primase-like protein
VSAVQSRPCPPFFRALRARIRFSPRSTGRVVSGNDTASRRCLGQLARPQAHATPGKSKVFAFVWTGRAREFRSSCRPIQLRAVGGFRLPFTGSIPLAQETAVKSRLDAGSGTGTWEPVPGKKRPDGDAEPCWFLAADFDKTSWMDDVTAFVETCRLNGLSVTVERVSLRQRRACWFFFSAPGREHRSQDGLLPHHRDDESSSTPTTPKYRLIGGRRSLVTPEEKVNAIADTYVKRTPAKGCTSGPTAICRRTYRSCSRGGARASRTTPRTRTRSRSVTTTA